MKQTPEILIRKADRHDARLISVLGAVTFYEAYFEQDAPPDLANYITDSFNVPEIEAQLANQSAEFFILYRNGKAVGYAKLRKDSKADCIEIKNAVELQRIYLLQAVWGAGVGEELLNFCLAEACRQGYESLWLGVWEENRRAIRFYEKQGFREVGEVSFPYGSTVGRNLVLEILL